MLCDYGVSAAHLGTGVYGVLYVRVRVKGGSAAHLSTGGSGVQCM